MKKVIIAVLAVLMVTPAFANNWGVGLKLGGGQNNPKGMKDLKDAGIANRTELDENGGIFGLEAMYEFNLNDEANKLGVKVGWDYYGENKLELKDIIGLGVSETIKEETYAFPFTVYYKRDNGVKNFSWFGGAGVTIIHTKVDGEGVAVGDDSKTKVFPHIVAGGEYRFTEVFALGLEARYNISAKVKKDGAVYSNRSGFGAALTGRFYF